MMLCKLATGGDDIKLWDQTTSTPLHQFSPHSHGISSLAWSQNNQLLVSASSGGDKVSLTYVKDATTNIINLAEGEKQTCLALNSTSRYMVTGGKNQMVSIWDIRNRKLKKTYKGHTSAVTCVTLNWNDTYMASGASNGDIILHNVVSGQASSALLTPKVQTIRELEYSHFKKSLLASVSDDGSLSLWDTNARKALHTFKDAHKASATSLSFSPVNDMLLTSVGLDKRIVCYDVVGKNAIKTISVESPLTCIAFMHDGATLAAGSTRGKVYMFDLRMGSTPLTTLNAHKTSVQCIAFQHGSLPKANGVSSIASKTPSTNQRNQKKAPLPSSSSLVNSVTPINQKDSKTDGIKDMSNGNGERLQHPMISPLRHDALDTMDVISPLREEKVSNGNRERLQHPMISPLRHDAPDTMDVISPLREGLGTPTTSNMPVISTSPPELLGRPEAVGKADIQYNDHFDSVFSPLASNVNDSATRKTPIGSVSFDPTPLVNNKPIAHIVSSDRTKPTSASTSSIGFDSTPVRTSPPSVSRHQPNSLGLGSYPIRDQITNHSRGLALSPEEPVRLKANDSSSITTPLVSQQYTASSGMMGLSGMPAISLAYTSPGRHHTPVRGILGGSTDSAKPPETTSLVNAVSSTLPHPGLEPSGVGAAGAAAAAGTSGIGAVGVDGVPFQAFQVEFMKNLIDDSLETFRDSIHVEIRNLQRDMVRQFQIQLNEMQAMLERYSVNEGLLSELERLREENKQLKNKY
ncbi:protein NEDD1-like [Amphiura filiformis]|uniref:protein NEDD1-like n=1 Tax=Amphiura filiformis TaxID=82378 RepID=UPI003B222860